MTDNSKYIVKNDSVYIEIDGSKVGQEISNLILIIKEFNEKIESLKLKMDQMDDESDEYYDLQDELNDYQMIVSDSEDRYEDLLNMPKV